MRAIVDGLERFCAFMWKGLQCDTCGDNYTGVTRTWNPSEIRGGAVRDGWQCNSSGDYCPDCRNKKEAI